MKNGDLENLCCYTAIKYKYPSFGSSIIPYEDHNKIMCLVWIDSEVPVPPGTLTDLTNPEETQPGLNNANQRIAMLSNQIKGVPIG